MTGQSHFFVYSLLTLLHQRSQFLTCVTILILVYN